MAVWVCSDLHFNHRNILKMCRTQFKTIEEHNDYIVKQYNEVVQKDDLVYILGDLGFTPLKELTPLVQRLNGRKILIIGNHDQGTDGDYQKMGFIQVCRHPVYYNTNIILSHIPVKECLNNPWVINIHGHLHMNTLNLPNYFNVNVELHDYRPIDISIYLEIAKDMCKTTRYEPFKREWFAEYYKRAEI